MNQKEKIMILALIEKAKSEERIKLKGHSYLKEVRFIFEDVTIGDKTYFYSWVAHTTNNRIVFPMASVHNVKFFKTLKGAKRNFIKNYIPTVI